MILTIRSEFNNTLNHFCFKWIKRKKKKRKFQTSHDQKENIQIHCNICKCILDYGCDKEEKKPTPFFSC